MKYLDAEPLINATPTDSMPVVEHERIGHSISSKLSWLKIYSSLPPQHPIHFIGLCAQVFLYYLGYGYLQVSFK